jgi:hypothetical protein
VTLIESGQRRVSSAHPTDTFAAQTKLGADVADVGFKQAMTLKAVKLNKGDVPVVVRLVRRSDVVSRVCSRSAAL